ncbi:Fe(3+) ABC transporter substrate-binding protein [Alphaproteobacteria bacterium]|nr:Fe(3+) ABC transporter substrate-binding protein [Alphaproteobacteria bacterium]
MKKYIFGLFTFIVIVFAFTQQSFAKSEVNVYSYRQPILIDPFFEEFTSQTGIKVNVLHAKKGLLERLLAEGADTPADLILTVDISRLSQFVEEGVLQAVNSTVLEKNIPSHLRDSENRWFALSKRARILVVSKERVPAGAITRIEDLASPQWSEKICTRKGSHAYNRSLLASIIAVNGETSAEDWAKSLVKNLARKPEGNDRAQAKAIFEGVCDIAIMNTYYYGKMKFNKKNPEQKEWANAIDLVFTNQNDRGNHINVAGGGVVKYSKNKENAIALLEFLTQPKAQSLYSSMNYEYPVNPTVPLSDELKSWGEFKEDELAIEKLAELAPIAQKIIDRVGW